MDTPAIALDERTLETIRQLAAEERRPEAEIVRDALELYAQAGKRPAPIGVGRYRSGSHDVSERARELIRDAVREGRWP
jgi:Ribbon-helix-helix protein, copG family